MLFFYFFQILIFQVVTGVIGQKKVFVRNHHVSYDYDFWYTCIKWWYPQYYFNEMLYHWDFWYTCIIWYFWVFFFISLFSLFFSFINECLKRNSEVCATFIYVWFFSFKVSNQRLSPSSWFIPLEMVVVITGTDTQ